MATEKPAPEAAEQKCASCVVTGRDTCPPNCIFRHILWPCNEKSMKVAENFHKYFAEANIVRLLAERANFSEKERIKFLGFLIKTSEDFEEDQIAGPYSEIKGAVIGAHGDGAALDGTGSGALAAPATALPSDHAGDSDGDGAPLAIVLPDDSSSAVVELSKMTVRKSTGGKAPKKQLVTEVDADGNEPVSPIPPPATEGSLIAEIDASNLIAP